VIIITEVDLRWAEIIAQMIKAFGIRTLKIIDSLLRIRQRNQSTMLT